MHMGYNKMFNNIYKMATNESELTLAVELGQDPKDLLVCWTLTL